jgi:hypothetical protein
VSEQPDKRPRPANLKPFPKGVSGNPAGRPKAVATQVLRDMITEQDIRTGWQVVISRAHAGDLQAWTIILDRLEGRPVQRQEHSGPDGGPIEGVQRLAELTDAELRAVVDAAHRFGDDRAAG